MCIRDSPKGTPAPVIAGGADASIPADERDNATASEDEQAHGIHLPSPSYYPLVTAVGLPIAGYGVIYQPLLLAVGFLIVLVGAFGWVLEPPAEPA